MRKGLAFCQGCDDDCDESNDQEYSNGTQPPFVALLPETFSEALQELGYRVLGHPYAASC